MNIKYSSSMVILAHVSHVECVLGPWAVSLLVVNEPEDDVEALRLVTESLSTNSGREAGTGVRTEYLLIVARRP